MIRKHTAVGAFVLAMATSFAIAASAQNTNSSPHAPPQAKAGEKGEATKPGDKGEKGADKGEKGADKGEKGADKGEKGAADKAKSESDRTVRREKERSELRAKLTSAWKGAPSDALRQELSRHAERLARLERIKDVADTEKDKDTSDKAQKLITKENERHEKWMTKHAPTPGSTTATTPGATTDTKKEGAQ